MNGDGREFIELKQQFIDYRERQQEANVDIKARLASIDASISALAPVITAHSERFKTLEDKCSVQGRSNASRIDRLEKGILGSISLVVVLFVTGIWNTLLHSK